MDDYQLIELIGKGSFGRVYKARRKYTGRLTAIKMIEKANMKEEDRKSFLREVDILRKVDHQNIMRLIETFETNDDFCVVTELGRGDLLQIINDGEKLKEDVLKDIAAQLVSALAYLHSNKIIHRDLKPQNILVTANGCIKLCDFGFARALSRSTVILSSVKGTPLYMAPEVVQEQDYTEKVDIWALGVILYELYYGHTPFVSNALYSLINKIIHDPVMIEDPISDDFRDFLLMTLEKDPSKRASCEELVNHRWIKDIDISRFNDTEYMYKKEQFEEAMQSPEFTEPTSRGNDPQTVLMNPDDYSPDDLLEALNALDEMDNYEESSIAVIFAEKASSLIKTAETAEKATKVAINLISVNPEQFLPVLSQAAVNLLCEKKIEVFFYPFIVNVLIKQYSRAKIDEFEIQEISLTKAQCQNIKDELCRSLFVVSVTDLEYVYSVLVFLVQTNVMFSNLFCNSVEQLLSTIVASVLRAHSTVITTAAITLITLIVINDDATFRYLVPIDNFLEAILKAIDDFKPNVDSFCLLSSAFGFIREALPLIAENPVFQKRVTNVSARKDFGLLVTFLAQDNYKMLLEQLLVVASISPRTDQEDLSYAATFDSPFTAFPIDESLLPLCIEKLPLLKPFHQVPLLGAMLSVTTESVIPHLPEMIDVFSVPSCTTDLCIFMLNAFETHKDLVDKVRESVCNNGLIPVLSGRISELGQNAPPAAVLLLLECILSYTQSCMLLRTCCKEIMKALFSADWSLEAAYIAAAHFARLSSEFILPLEQCGAIESAAKDLSSDIARVRTRAATFLGNVWRHGGRSTEFSSRVMPLLVKQLNDEYDPAAAAAAFAVGNAVYHTIDVASYLTNDFGSIADLLVSNYERASECAALLLSSILKKGSLYLQNVLDNRCIERLLEVSSTEKGALRMVPAFTSLVQYEEGKKALKNAGAVKILHKIAKSGSDTTKITLSTIIYSIEK